METDEIEIDLKELLLALKKKILIILLVTVIFAGIGGGVTIFLITPIYSSTSTLYVMSQSTSIASLADIQVGTSLTQDYIVLINTRPVINKVIENLGLDYTYEEMLGKITVTNETDTRMLKLKVEDPDPELAQQIVNELTTVAVDRITEKMAMEDPSIIEEGYIAISPDSPSLKQNIALGALLGLLLSVGIVVFAFIMNDTVRSSEDIEQYLGITVLAAVPKEKRMAKQARNHTGSDSHGIVESMNTLKTNIAFCGDEVQVIALTSCVTGEGKSSIAFELAKSLADSDNRVLLIDADNRKSEFLQTGEVSGIEIGLTNYLSGQIEMKYIFYEEDIKNLAFIPAGSSVPNPTALIANEKFEKLIEISRRVYSYIIINATPIGMVIDAAIVAKQCDGLVMVIEQGKNNKRMIGRAVEQLKRTETRILGAVLNKVD